MGLPHFQLPCQADDIGCTEDECNDAIFEDLLKTLIKMTRWIWLAKGINHILSFSAYGDVTENSEINAH